MTFGTRAQAARIVAGYIVMVDAAQMMGMPKYLLHRLEDDAAKPHEGLLSQLAILYDVSESFLSEGIAATATELLSQRIDALLERSRKLDREFGQQGANRLRSIRIAAGYERPSVAAAKLGWKTPTYSAHEGGTKTISADRMIAYAMAFGANPEFALFGEGNMFPPENETIVWKPKTDLSGPKSLLDKSQPRNWKWMNRERATNRVHLPIVEIVDQKFLVMSGGAITLPSGLLPAWDDDLHPRYALKREATDSFELLVICPSIPEGNFVFASKNGDVTISEWDGDEYIPTDVIADLPENEDPIPLGLLTAKVSVEF